MKTFRSHVNEKLKDKKFAALYKTEHELLTLELDKIVSKKSSDWLEKAEWEIANEDWLDKSAKIALKILRTIREKNVTRIKLAELLNVSPRHISKIVQGKENLTLETISKIEKVLNITLIDVKK